MMFAFEMLVLFLKFYVIYFMVASIGMALILLRELRKDERFKPFK